MDDSGAPTDLRRHPAPMHGVFDFGAPGADLDLYQGDTTVAGESIGNVRIWLGMTREITLRWQAADGAMAFLSDPNTMTVEHPEIGRVEIPIRMSHSNGWGTVLATELQRASKVSRIIIHWINLPYIHPSKPLSSDGRIWAGRWQVESCGWQFTLDSRSDLTEVLTLANELDEQYVMTHVGELRRVDGTEYDVSEASDVLFGWQLAMSFALGRWVAPAVPIGFDLKGRNVWEKWAPWRCDSIRGYQSWWDDHTGDDLCDFFDAFLSAFLDEDRHDEVRLVALYLISANHSGTTGEGKVMLAQAGLEYFTWVNLVLSKRVSPKNYKEMRAAERLRLVLSRAGIPLDVPDGLSGLSSLAKEKGFDGPSATSWVRNKLVHPKDAGEPYRIKGLVWETAQLMLEYGELLLLNRLGYRGRFTRRYPPGRWAHSWEPVPWAAGQPS